MKRFHALSLVLTFILSLTICSSNLKAEEHAVGPFVGTDINLTAYDHAFAGQIKNFVAFGWVDEATFTSTLTIRKYELTSIAEFKKTETGIGGTLSMGDHQVSVQFLGVDQATQSIKFSVNGEEVIVAVAAEDYVDGHFVNPTYTTQLAGKNYTYHLKGEACYGLSLHYNMMILAALSI